jgi:glutathione S-transferase
MKLYYAPEACSLADHIALLDVGEALETEAVDLHTKRTESGLDFKTINPKGYVPALVLADGEIITENVAVLDWIADQHPQLRPAGPLGRTRLVESLTFISTEIHRAYKPLWHDGPEAALQAARDEVSRLLHDTAERMLGGYLLGDAMSAADCYLYVMLRWATRFGIAVPGSLVRLKRLMEERPSVRAALAAEGRALAA